MKEQHPIDGLFQRQLGEYELDPPMHLWAGVERRLPAGFPSFRSVLLLAALCGVLAASLCRDSRPSSAAMPLDSPLAALTPPSAKERPNIQQEISITAPPLPNATSSQEASAPSETVTAYRAKTTSRVAQQSPAAKGIRTGVSMTQKSDIASFAHTEMEDAVSEKVNEGTGAEDLFQDHKASLLSPLAQRAATLEPYPLDDFLYQGIKFLGERWFAGVELGTAPIWAQRSLLAKGAEYEPYAQARNQSETLRMAYAASLRLSLISASGITLRSGIQFTEFKESFTPDAGDPVTNRFQLVDIPITFGYEFSAGKTNIGLHGGPVLNMAFYQQGRFLAEDLKEIVDFSSSTPDAYPAFRNRMGVGLYGGVTITHPITPSLHLFAEPYIRVFPESFTANDYPLEQRYRTAGVFIGMRKLMGPYWMHIRP